MDPEPARTVVDPAVAPPVDPFAGFLTATSFALIFLVVVGLFLLVRLRKRGHHGVD